MEERTTLLTRIRAALSAHKQTALLLLLTALLFAVAGSRYTAYIMQREQPEQVLTKLAPEESAEQPVAIAVDIKGAVQQPGLYWLESGQRVADALEQAVLLPDADIDMLNLAAQLQDGQQLIVPYLELDEEQRRDRFDQLAEQTAGFGAVNINTAGLAELQTLPGIGETKAQSIIDFREEQGPFASVEELTRVSGIGDAILEELRELICVE